MGLKVEIGGLYSIDNGRGRVLIAKALLVDDEAVHARIYMNAFAQRPGAIDTSTLNLGTIFDEGFPGIGHMPVAAELWQSWTPELLATEPVTDDELDGYREWRRAQGGVFTAWPF